MNRLILYVHSINAAIAFCGMFWSLAVGDELFLGSYWLALNSSLLGAVTTRQLGDQKSSNEDDS